jgi:hypothetical protein
MKSLTTKVHVIKQDGYFYQIKDPTPDSTTHYVKWRPATVGNWSKIIQEDPLSDSDGRILNPAEIERRAWKYMVLETSLVPPYVQLLDEDGETEPDALSIIMSHIPGFVPKVLVRPLLYSTTITKAEVDRIERECGDLWGKNSSVSNPHPLLEQVISFMGMSERFGISAFLTIDDIPQKMYQAMRHIMITQGKLSELGDMTKELREKAIRESGAARYLKKR